MDIKLNDAVVHLWRAREANGAALESLEASAKIQVAALNTLCAAFADMVLLRVEALAIAFPVIGVKVLHMRACQLFDQATTTTVGAPPQLKSGNTPGATIAR